MSDLIIDADAEVLGADMERWEIDERVLDDLPHWKRIMRRQGRELTDKEARYMLALFLLGSGDARKVPLESGKIRIEASDGKLARLVEKLDLLPTNLAGKSLEEVEAWLSKPRRPTTSNE